MFISTPKSGSHTGFRLMEDYFKADKTSFNHNKVVPTMCKNYFKFSFVRDPYERFCALYHACVINDRKPFIPKKVQTIVQYAKWMANIKLNNSYPRIDLCAPQYVWHLKTNVDKFIKIEEAEKVFNELYPELNIKMPHELKRKHLIWEDVKNKELQLYVDIWAQIDSILYGYHNENCYSQTAGMDK